MSNHKLVIKGICENGKKFRPSDWVERLASTCATFDAQRRLHWHAGVAPVYIEQEKCLSLDASLAQSAPAIWDYAMGFARANKLVIMQSNVTELVTEPMVAGDKAA